MSRAETGWLPYEDRNLLQRKITDRFHEQVGRYSLIGSTIEKPPERFIWAEQEQKIFGKLLPRCIQKSGCCVGAGSWVALLKSFFGDMVYRQDNDLMKPHFPWAPYGKGREIAGMRGPGEGSFGAAQAKAVDDDVLGLLPYDDSRFPQPKIRDDFWWHWDRSAEIKWSHPSSWPVAEREIAAEGKPFGCKDIVRVENAEQTVQLTAQGYGITVASMYGTRPRIKEGVLLGEWNDQWAHQMSLGGYWFHPKLGLIFIDDNQWSKGAYNGLNCPTLAEFGSNGSTWCLEKDWNRRCKRGEVYAHASGGFPKREILWDDWGIVFS